MTKAQTAGPAAVPATINPDLIGNVEVTLEGVLGTRSITVAELSALKADDVVTLNAKLSAAVELRLNGVHVARGELVAVDDCFAVRITEIAP